MKDVFAVKRAEDTTQFLEVMQRTELFGEGVIQGLHCADEDAKGSYYVCAVPVPSVLTVHVASPTVSTITCVSHATSGRHPVRFVQHVHLLSALRNGLDL